MKHNSSRKFKCPFCSYTNTRDKLVSHVDKEHEDMIPQDYTAARVVFNSINKKTTGKCIVCGRETKWNERTWKYERHCGRQICRDALRKEAQKNLIKVRGVTSAELLRDPMHQEKMLSNRSISGKYRFRKDGKEVSYVGSYERKLLEFMDKVLDIPSTDIMSPGPVFDYEYNDTHHKYISDQLYIPYNLIIEVKDGGSNPNKRQMDSYREKQLAKEKVITDQGVYNYIRLTNNNFEQLMDILMELKYQMIDNTYEDGKSIIRIHEEVNGIPNSRNAVYIIPYGYKNVFDQDEIEGYAVTRDIGGVLLVSDDDGSITTKSFKEFLEYRQFGIYEYVLPDKNEKYLSILESINDNKVGNIEQEFLLEETEANINTLSKLDCRFVDVDIDFNAYEKSIQVENIIEASMEEAFIKQEKNKVYLPLLRPKDIEFKNDILSKFNTDIDIFMDKDNKYFAMSNGSKLRTKSFDRLDSIVDAIKVLDEISYDKEVDDNE